MAKTERNGPLIKKSWTYGDAVKYLLLMEKKEIPAEYYGWWRITDITTWMKEDLDAIGTALISFTGDQDRLRMIYLLAHITCKPIKTGVSFSWKGAWEFDQLTGSGRVTRCKFFSS